MMIEKFIEELVKSVEAGGKGLEVIPTEKEGTNGVIQHGLIFKQNDSNVAPVLYVDEIFKRYSAGELSMGNVTEHLIRKYEELPEPCISDIDAMMTAPDIINKITLRLVNGPENEGMIERRRLVYHEIKNTDLVCIFHVTILMEKTSLGSIAVSREILERYLPDFADGNELYDEVVKRVVAENIYMESIVSGALLETDETKSKERLSRELEDREKGLSVEGAEVLKDYRASDMKILDSYAPMYEFEE